MPDVAGLRRDVTEALPRSGVENPVTAVLLNFRAWDTLLESVVLLAALIGVWSLARDDAWGGRPGLRQHARPGGVLCEFRPVAAAGGVDDWCLPRLGRILAAGRGVSGRHGAGRGGAPGG
jgi:hypothetical protein